MNNHHYHTMNLCKYMNLNSLSERITQPEELKIELMPHQKTAIYAMKDLEKKRNIITTYKYFENNDNNICIETNIGILGDKVGSGKTYMIIGLICSNNDIVYSDNYFSSKKYIKIKKQIDNLKFVNGDVVCVPETIFSQWKNAFVNLHGFNIIEVKSNYNIKDFVFNVNQKKDIILITEKMILSFFEKHKNIVWNRIFIDEADTINMKNIELPAKFIWLVTGTPSGIALSKKKYLNEIFGDYKKWICDFITIKNNNLFIDESIKLPLPIKVNIQCHTPLELSTLIDFIPNNVVSMINAGNIDDAVKFLNCNKGSSESIFSIVTKNISIAIENKSIELKALKEKKYTGKDFEDNEKVIKKTENIIKRLENRFESIKKKFDDIKEELCPICMGEINNQTVLDCCNSFYCFECITLFSSQKHKCPTCQKNISIKNIHIVNGENNNKKCDKECLLDKIDQLKNILNHSIKEKLKTLVFADYSSTFDKIENILEKNNLHYNILKGSDKQITKILEEYNDGKKNILLLNATNFGAGMNLQMTDQIIMYHRFSREMEEQIIGRAQRYGRTKQLKVIYLLHSNETVYSPELFKFNDMTYQQYLETIET